MDDKLSIQVTIAERLYPLRVERKDEENIRKAAKIINDKVIQYKQRYAGKEVQDCLAMASLQFVIQRFDTEQRNDLGALVEELEQMNDYLAEFIEKENI